MREIKFRFFAEGEFKQAFTVDNLYGVIYETCRDSDGQVESEYVEVNDMGGLSQYTGLKDKNGVEIYEGDIITVDNYGGSVGVVKFGNHGTSTDYYHDVAYGYYIKDAGMNEYNLINYGDKVVGNIYENPGLI